ncbi:MAG: hypothetical protein E5Y32_32610, partial [Mesorhizobium sp.]
MLELGPGFVQGVQSGPKNPMFPDRGSKNMTSKVQSLKAFLGGAGRVALVNDDLRHVVGAVDGDGQRCRI